MPLLVDDRDLLRRFREGEPQALTRVFRHYAPAVAALLCRGFTFKAANSHIRFFGLQDSFALEDSLQEIFRRAFSEHARQVYDGLRPYRTYLGAIARNVVINEYHTRNRSLEQYGFEHIESFASEEGWSASDDPLSAESFEPSGQPARDAETSELRRLVTTFVGALGGREADVFALRFGQGLSHSEITARVGMTASKVKTAEARIRKSLLRFLRRHGYLVRHRLSRPAPRRHPLAQGEPS